MGMLVGGSLCSLQGGGGVCHDQVHAGGNKAVGDGGAGSGIALCVLEVELHVVAELCGQSVLKALRCSVQSGVLHQLADADGVAFAVGSGSEPLRQSKPWRKLPRKRRKNRRRQSEQQQRRRQRQRSETNDE